jgi:hypothetical protein
MSCPSPLHKDFVGGEAVRAILAEASRKHITSDEQGGRDDFLLAHRLLKSKVRSLYCTIEELSPERTSGERFDLAFAGSILCHVANPIAALRAVRSVTGGTIVVANPYEPERRQSNPVARLVGRHEAKLTTWWIPTLSCMEDMLYAAGFGDVRLVAKNILLRSNTGSISPHFVMHARAEASDEHWRQAIRTAPRGYRRFWPRKVAGAIARRLGLR